MKKEKLPEWDLSRFYASPKDPKIVKDMESLTKKYSAFQKKYKGNIKFLSGPQIEMLLTELQSLDDTSERLGSYIGLLSTTDTINAEYNKLMQKIREWSTEVSQKMLFVGLEWKSLPDKIAKQKLETIKNPLYKHYLTHVREFASYALKEDVEEIILEKNITGAQSFVQLFNKLTSTLTYEVNKKKLTQSEVLTRVTDKDRSVRKEASEAVTKTLASREMELTHIFNTLLTEKMLSDKRRGYKTWLTGRNLGNKVSDTIVDNLVTSVTSRYTIAEKHYALKKKLLQLDELFDYDRYAPLTVSTKETSFSWHEAQTLVTNSYASFSPETGKIIDEFFTEKYIHAEPLPNKRGGAFCASTVSSAHPYILMNFMGKTDDVMTLAHELGHGLHQYLAGKSQGDYGLGMPLTTQELASTFGEMIVFHNLKNNILDPKEKLTLLTQKIDGMIATVFRQIAMHSFEDLVHTKRTEGSELSTEDINNAWITTQRKMFGKSVTLRNEYKNWWSYIPHFIHTPGYVYAYSFGELLALSLYNLYQKDPDSFVPKYIALLKAGDSDYPVNLLKKAGIDISKPDIWNEGLDTIENLIKEEEELSAQILKK